MDTYDKLGILGERSVMRVLILHSFRNLRAAGIKEYAIYSTRGTSLQGKEIDLIEEWTDGRGEKHKKAHEVKCEKSTLDFHNKVVSKKYDAAFTTGAVDVSKVKWTCKPTGKYFIELVQNVSSAEAYKYRDEYNLEHSPLDVSNVNGWYPAFAAAAGIVEEQFTDGRDIWFVSYTPKPKVRKTTVTDHTKLYYDLDTGIITEKRGSEGDYVLAAEPPRGFIVMQLPDNGEHDQLFEYVYGGSLEAKPSKNNYTGKWSMGLLLPIKTLYPNFPMGENGRIVSGEADTKSGAVLYNDLAVWANEKDITEPWSADDGVIEPFRWAAD